MINPSLFTSFQPDLKLQVQNIWLSEQEHLRQFLDAADWFIENQDDNGGWPSQVLQLFVNLVFQQQKPEQNKNIGSSKTKMTIGGGPI